MMLAMALERSPVQMATRKLSSGEQIIHSAEHGTFLKRSPEKYWELRPEFADHTKGDWEPIQPGHEAKKLLEAISGV